MTKKPMSDEDSAYLDGILNDEDTFNQMFPATEHDPILDDGEVVSLLDSIDNDIAHQYT